MKSPQVFIREYGWCRWCCSFGFGGLVDFTCGIFSEKLARWRAKKKKKEEKERKEKKRARKRNDGRWHEGGGRKVTSKCTADVKLWVFFGTKYLGYILFQTVQKVQSASCRTGTVYHHFANTHTTAGTYTVTMKHEAGVRVERCKEGERRNDEQTDFKPDYGRCENLNGCYVVPCRGANLKAFYTLRRLHFFPHFFSGLLFCIPFFFFSSSLFQQRYIFLLLSCNRNNKNVAKKMKKLL